MMDGLDVAQIEELYRCRYGYFFRVALGMFHGDEDRARDAVQEAFARALRAREGFRGEGSVESWLWRTLTNVCLREARSTPEPVPEVDDAGDLYPSEWRHVRAAIARLPERQRLILFLRHYADLDYEEIASIVRVERGTVAATLHAAQGKLRAWIEGVCP